METNTNKVNGVHASEEGLKETGVMQSVYRMLEEGESVHTISQELELPKKDIEDIYTEWKNEKMGRLVLGDNVCFVLNMSGYAKQLVHGKVHKKLTNSVIVDCGDNAYVSQALKGKVAVSVKDVLKI